jgi:molybdopterin converting factor small subunit
MAIVHIPALLRELANNDVRVEVPAATVREVIAVLEQRYPGIAARLTEDGRLRKGIAVAIDGEIATLGLLERLSENAEIHFIPSIQGG